MKDQRPINKRQDGQTLVEFAVALPLLALLLFGIIQYGFIFGAYVTVRNASQVGARQAVINSTNAANVAVTYLGPMLQTTTPPASATLTSTNIAGVAAQKMTVTYELPLIIPWVVFGSTANNTLTLTASTVMR